MHACLYRMVVIVHRRYVEHRLRALLYRIARGFDVNSETAVRRKETSAPNHLAVRRVRNASLNGVVLIHLSVVVQRRRYRNRQLAVRVQLARLFRLLVSTVAH